MCPNLPGLPSPYWHTESDQTLEVGTAWERGHNQPSHKTCNTSMVRAKLSTCSFTQWSSLTKCSLTHHLSEVVRCFTFKLTLSPKPLDIPAGKKGQRSEVTLEPTRRRGHVWFSITQYTHTLQIRRITGASLSELHTSVTSLHMCTCMFAWTDHFREILNRIESIKISSFHKSLGSMWVFF